MLNFHFCRVYTTCIILLITLCNTSCAKSCDDKPVNTQETKDTVVIETKDTVPEWVRIDTNFIEDCTVIYSKNMIVDTMSFYNVFPFVAIDKSGNHDFFCLVTLRRYDMLYVNKLSLVDFDMNYVDFSYINRISVHDNCESVLFALEKHNYKKLDNLGKGISFSSWGLFGSVSNDLSEEQIKEILELVSIAETYE